MKDKIYFKKGDWLYYRNNNLLKYILKMIKVLLIVNSAGKIRIRRFFDEVECLYLIFILSWEIIKNRKTISWIDF